MQICKQLFSDARRQASLIALVKYLPVWKVYRFRVVFIKHVFLCERSDRTDVNCCFHGNFAGFFIRFRFLRSLKIKACLVVYLDQARSQRLKCKQNSSSNKKTIEQERCLYSRSSEH